MRIDEMPKRKQREIEVGRRFIEAYNQRTGDCFTLDESYWDVEADPAPDLRFVSASETIFGEVVSFDEAGQEGFVRRSATGRLLGAVEEALGAAGAEGFLMWLEPADPRKVPHGQRLKADAAALTRYAVEKAELFRKQHYRWDEQHERAGKFALSNLREIDIFLSPSPRASCAVSGGVRKIDTAGALAETIQGKGLQRYSPGTHLLVDGQGHFVTSGELLEMLEGRVVTIEGYAGVWFVSLQEPVVVPLHEARPARVGYEGWPSTRS